MPHTQSIGILWDLQNTPCKKLAYPIEELVYYIQKHGSIYDRAVFHDFKSSDDPVLEKFEDADFTTVAVTTRQKNNADRAIIGYARKHYLANSKVTTVVLITSDDDFTPLVKELQQAGKKVWVIYKNKPSQRLRLAADRCIPWSDLKLCNASAPVSSKPPFGKPTKQKNNLAFPLKVAMISP